MLSWHRYQYGNMPIILTRTANKTCLNLQSSVRYRTMQNMFAVKNRKNCCFRCRIINDEIYEVQYQADIIIPDATRATASRIRFEALACPIICSPNGIRMAVYVVVVGFLETHQK